MTQEEINILTQGTQQKFIKLEVYDSNNNRLNEIQGNLLGGNLSIDSKASIRRSLSGLSFVVTDSKYIPSYNSYFWINTKIRIAVGILSIFTKKIVWFHLGYFLLDKPDLKRNQTQLEITIGGIDYMGNLNGQRGGFLSSAIKTEVVAAMPISQSIRTTLSALGNENNYMVDDIKSSNGTILNTPYTIDMQPTDTVYTLIEKLGGLYMGWEIFYSPGTVISQPIFTYQSIKNRMGDPVSWDFSQNNTIIDIGNQPDFDNIANDIWIWGSSKDGSQSFAHIQNTNANSPFSITNLGKTISKSIIESTYSTNAECLARAEYELWTRSYLAESINIVSVPLFPLDVNQIIYLNNPEVGIVGKYLITNISFDLKPTGTMTIAASRLYVYQSDATTY